MQRFRLQKFVQTKSLRKKNTYVRDQEVDLLEHGNTRLGLSLGRGGLALLVSTVLDLDTLGLSLGSLFREELLNGLRIVNINCADLFVIKRKYFDTNQE